MGSSLAHCPAQSISHNMPEVFGVSAKILVQCCAACKARSISGISMHHVAKRPRKTSKDITTAC